LTINNEIAKSNKEKLDEVSIKDRVTNQKYSPLVL